VMRIWSGYRAVRPIAL